FTSVMLRLLASSPFFLYCPIHHRHLHSFPTRRSSDLPSPHDAADALAVAICHVHSMTPARAMAGAASRLGAAATVVATTKATSRSEEHTSELQSLRHLVCRLLLEKKKKTDNHI